MEQSKTGLALNAFLTGDGLASTLAGPGVGLSLLAPAWQAASMTIATIAANITKPGDVLSHLTAKGAFNHVIVLDERGQLSQFVLAQAMGPLLGVQT